MRPTCTGLTLSKRMERGGRQKPSAPEATLNSLNSASKSLESAVPRFASFKPRPPTASRDDEKNDRSRTARSVAPEKRGDCHTEPRFSKHRKHLHKEHGRSGRADKDLPTSASGVDLDLHHSPDRSGYRNLDDEDIAQFREDRRSDENNVRYGAPSRYTVPKYREAGRYGILGLSRDFKTTPELEPGRRLITAEHFHPADRRVARSLRTGLLKETGPALVVALKKNDAEVDAHKSYLPLSPYPSRKRQKLNDWHSHAEGLPENLQQDNNYDHDPDKSAAGQNLESLSTSSDPDSESEHTPGSDSGAGNSTRERHVHLSRLVNEDPSNVNAWLALIQHQDLLLAESGGDFTQVSSDAQNHGHADVKLSMYKKALSKTKGHPLQDWLVHGMMMEGAKVWDNAKLTKEWKSVLNGLPDSLRLWVQYLTFRQTNFLSFTYESCRDLFKDCLNMIRKRQASSELEGIRSYVFVQMTTFMREAGFSEHAHALWQAIFEYCYFEPMSDQAGDELFSFEEFWDSEVPRLGEEGARGWRMSRRSEVLPRSDPFIPTTTYQGDIRAWSVQEQQKMSSSTLPARTLDEVDEDDPFRVILFSDIQPFLFRPSGEEAQKQLLQAFLYFCHLLPFRPGPLNDRSLSEDAFINNPLRDVWEMSLDGWIIPSERSQPFDFPMPSFIIDTASLWSDNEYWPNPWRGLHSVLSNKVRCDWVQRSLQQLLAASPKDELLAEYILAFNTQVDVKEARKKAKSLLKHDSSIRLYNAFALLECSTGNFQAAERVWCTTLSMRPSFSKTSQQDVILIWRSWLWALLDRRDFSRALRVCLAVADEKVTLDDLSQSVAAYSEGHPTTKLRAHQYLSSHLNQNLSLNNPDLSVHYLDVLTVWTYLTSDHDLAASLAHYTTTSTHPTISQSPSALCLVHQSRARLLHLHARTSRSGYRPSDITIPLSESIRLFPGNTIFLCLYHFHTRRFLLTDRIREVIPTLAMASSTNQLSTTATATASHMLNPLLRPIIPTLFHIYSELNRPTFAGSTSHSIRAAFEEAVASPHDRDPVSKTSPAGRHSPIIWKLYILWEVHVASSPPATKKPAQSPPMRPPKKSTSAESKREHAADRAVGVFHRAIRACPWCKSLYMLAFSVPDLRDAMGEEQLRGVYDLMQDKGLRVHVDLDLDLDDCTA
ncbi:hypothetical protein EPUS_02856 [Endocarpon pusillum Z07020]|uniref:DUF1740-domain-containing protein n=1 Tax=Endocarpon pusillum (strain Z07020 / HMAS-L-300199) TaxID=1263415 RepID=U1HTI2_ENDPU|nr:uncharacterized protein EPUS_02856 [Endocarpon pusillum Z07020]ERF72574.1 hypothetical protein EPUS_02856 [Endocarpon pusillum Z07020]